MRDADGQWRISQPPRGLLISQSLFSSTWVRADVCFWDATGTVLVPDPRFVQKGTLGMAASVRALLVGPRWPTGPPTGRRWTHSWRLRR